MNAIKILIDRNPRIDPIHLALLISASQGVDFNQALALVQAYFGV